MTSRTSSIAARNFCSSMCVRRANTRKTIFPAQISLAKASSNVTSRSGFPILTRPWCFIVAADFALRWRPTICRRWVIRMCSQWMEESAAGAKKDTHSHGSRCDPVSLPPLHESHPSGKRLGGRRLKAVHGFQNGGDNVLVSNGGVDHHVIERAGRPIGVEVVFNELNAFTVDRVHHLFGFAFTLTDTTQPAQLLGARRVEENAEHVVPLSQKVRITPPHDDAFSAFRDPSHDLLSDRDEAIGIERLRARKWHAAFIASSPEYFREPMKRAVTALIADCHGGRIDVRRLCDFLGQSPIPKLPPEPACENLGNVAGAAAKLAFNGEYPVHRPYLLLFTIRDVLWV